MRKLNDVYNSLKSKEENDNSTKEKEIKLKIKDMNEVPIITIDNELLDLKDKKGIVEFRYHYLTSNGVKEEGSKENGKHEYFLEYLTKENDEHYRIKIESNSDETIYKKDILFLGFDENENENKVD